MYKLTIRIRAFKFLEGLWEKRKLASFPPKIKKKLERSIIALGGVLVASIPIFLRKKLSCLGCENENIFKRTWPMISSRDR